MKKLKGILLIIIIVLGIIIPQVNAADDSVKIELNDNKITVNGEDASTSQNSNVYLSTKMNNGGTSQEAEKENIEVTNIININKAGTYEFTGTISDAQISINANEVEGEVIIVLNNVQLTCKEAPAIFVYSKNVENENCKVTIKTAKGSENTITGAKIKTSVEGWEDQDNLYYYVDKGYNDENEYYERYKYDGAISSDISLTFEGEGILNVVSSKKEGIESKMNITINSGIINVDSKDDGINACTDNKSTITINGGTIVVKVDSEADEGDGIDSNGSLYINGGTVYAFACPGSDNGLDSDNGVYINGGVVLSTGSMYEELKSANNQKIVQMNLSTEVNEGDSIVIVDDDGNQVFAFKADRKISTFAYSSKDLEDKEYLVYSGTDVTGDTDKNGIYTKIDNLNLYNLTKQENSNTGMMGEPQDGFNSKEIEQTSDNKYFIIVLGGCLVALILIIVVTTIYSKKKGKKKK